MASEISSSERGPDWANLLPEILARIAIRLAALDYLNFSAVCTSWASIASPGYGMPPPLPLCKQHPFLLLRGDDGEQSDSITLLDIFDCPRRSYKIEQLPEIGGKWFIGSQFGWVALLDEFSNPSLLNPFTRALVVLPPITTLPNVTPDYDSNGSLSGYFFRTEEDSFSLEEFRAAFPICKVVLSSDPTDGNFTAAAILGHVLMFLRPGEKSWNYLKKPIAQSDVIYREGKFLTFTQGGDFYEIDPCDLSVQKRVFANTDRRFTTLRYLVDSLGDLLQVRRDNQHMPTYITHEISVWRLDPETSAWVPVSSLGDRALFIGTSCSMSIPAGYGVKGNCIYFTDDYWDQLQYFPGPAVREMARDMGVFDMTNMSFEVLYPPKPQLNWPPPIWITSPLFVKQMQIFLDPKERNNTEYKLEMFAGVDRRLCSKEVVFQYPVAESA